MRTASVPIHVEDTLKYVVFKAKKKVSSNIEAAMLYVALRFQASKEA